MEALQVDTRAVADLPLEPVVEAWGIERIEDIQSRLGGRQGWVAVRDGSDSVRVIPAAQILSANSDLMIDMLGGGYKAVIVEATVDVRDLPDARPLLVERHGDVIGLLGGDQVEQTQSPFLISLQASNEGADAAMAAWAAVRYHRDVYRKKGIALVLDIQPSRVAGDGRLVKNTVDILLDEALELIGRARGGTGVHVVVGQGVAGLWIGIEAHGANFPEAFLLEMLEDGPTEDPTALALRRVRDRISDHEGHMKVDSGRTGTRFVITLPRPAG